MIVRKNVLEYIIALDVSRDKIPHYFDRLICQRLYYDAEIA
jgi:hypothetical protein